MNNYLFFYCSILSSIIPIIFIGVHRLKSNQNRFRSIFYIFLLVRFLSDLGNIILEKVIDNSFPVFHFSITIQFFLILELFYMIRKIKTFFNTLAFVFFILDLTVTSNVFQNNHLSTMYTYFVISGFGMVYLYNISGDLFKKTILSSISIYTIAFVFLLCFEEIILKSKELNNYLINFMALLSLMLNIIFSYALCLKPKN
jgi:hypothetical protein